jgi:hypothetical protein
MKAIKIGLALTLLIASSLLVAKDKVPTYKRAQAPIAQRVADLLARMTLDEKIAQLQSNWTVPFGPGGAAGIVKDGKIDEAIARQTLSNGLGTFVTLSLTASPTGVTCDVDHRRKRPVNPERSRLLRGNRLVQLGSRGIKTRRIGDRGGEHRAHAPDDVVTE